MHRIWPLRGISARSRGAARHEPSSTWPRVSNTSNQPTCRSVREARPTVFWIASSMLIPPDQVAAGGLCVQGAIVGCDRDNLGRLGAKALFDKLRGSHLDEGRRDRQSVLGVILRADKAAPPRGLCGYRLDGRRVRLRPEPESSSAAFRSRRCEHLSRKLPDCCCVKESAPRPFSMRVGISSG